MKTNQLIVVLMLLTAVTTAQNSKYSVKEVYETSTSPKLTISSHDCDMKISTTNSSQITIHYVVKRNNKQLDIGMDELKEYFQIDVEKPGNGLELKIRPKQKNKLENWKNRLALDLEIITPEKTICTLNTVDGDLLLNGLKNRLQCKTVDGDIQVSEAEGGLKVKTVDGDINIEEIAGDVVVETTDGDLKVKNVTGNVEIKTTDGDIQFYGLQGNIICTATDGDIKGKISNLKAPCKCVTVDGDIHITLPEDLGFNIEMKGESLNADFKDFNGEVKKKQISGKVNGGGALLGLSTNDGDIDLVFE